MISMRPILIALGLLSVTIATSIAEPAAKGLTIEGRVAFTEGPAWNSENGNVYFTDIQNNRIMRRDPTGVLHVYRQPSGRANGLAFDKQGRLLACEGGREGGNFRVTRTEKDGSITVLTDRFEGKRYNSPNDLCIAADGGIYFTDPRYGDRTGVEQIDEKGREIEGVYRIAPDGSVTRILSHEVERPNGIALSPDGKTLYVADNANDRPGQNRKLWSFTVKADGSVDKESQKELFDWGNERGPDGMCVAADGKIYVTAGLNFASTSEAATRHKAGVYVIEPEKGLVDFLPVPEDMITNCTIGGKDGQTLFITSGHKLWSLKLKQQ